MTTEDIIALLMAISIVVVPTILWVAYKRETKIRIDDDRERGRQPSSQMKEEQRSGERDRRKRNESQRT